MNAQHKTDDAPRPTIDFGYPTPANGPIPAFQSIEEEAEFWDTHSYVDFLDQFELIENLPMESSVPLVLGYPERAYLEKMARERGLLPSSLVRKWVEERLEQERKAS